MASTYSPEDALEYVKTMTKSLPLERIREQLLDQASKKLWMAAPWRWTIGSMPLITIISGMQDYSITFPADFLYLFDGYVTESGGIPRNVTIEPAITPDCKVIGNVSAISVETGNILRVFPKPPTLSSDPLFIVTRYKKASPAIISATSCNPILVFPDEWFWVYCEAVLYLAYKYADDQRAGSAQVDSQGRAAFTGQLGVFEAALAVMKQREKLPTEWVNPVPDIKVKDR